MAAKAAAQSAWGEIVRLGVRGGEQAGGAQMTTRQSECDYLYRRYRRMNRAGKHAFLIRRRTEAIKVGKLQEWSCDWEKREWQRFGIV